MSTNLAVFAHISNHRSTFGAQNADYDKYARHCGVQVAKLRRSLGLQQKSKKGKVFTKKDVSQSEDAGLRHAQLLLFEAERAWATSQSLKSQIANSKTITSKAQTKHRMLQRLSKAASHAAALRDMMETQKVPSLLQAEVSAYQCLLQATVFFEKGDDKSASEALQPIKDAKTLLDLIAQKTPQMVARGFAYQLLEDADQMQRIVTYRISPGASTAHPKSRDTSVQSLESELKAIEAVSSKYKTEFRWKQQVISITNPELAKTMTLLELSINRRKSMTELERNLTTLSQAEDLARRLRDENQAALERSRSVRFEEASIPLQKTHDFILFRLLKLRLKRDFLLIAKSKHRVESQGNPQTVKKKPSKVSIKKQAKGYSIIVKLYEGVVTTLEQLRDLPMVENDLSLGAQVETRIEWAKTEKCYYLAEVYGLVESFDKALLINDHCSLYLRQAISAQSIETPDEASTEDFPSIKEATFPNLETLIARQRERLSKKWYHLKTSQPTAKETLGMDDLNLEGKEEANKAKKNVVFDISYNYVTEFDMDAINAKSTGEAVSMDIDPVVEAEKEVQEVIAELPKKAEPPKKRGLWGLWSS